MINAWRVVVVDDALIPTGASASVVATALAYTTPRGIGGGALDHCFMLDDADRAAVLTDRRSGRQLRLRTDQPGLAVYSGERLEAPRSGLCIQTGALPDAPNRSDFPSARLNPGETYDHHSRFELSPT